MPQPVKRMSPEAAQKEYEDTQQQHDGKPLEWSTQLSSDAPVGKLSSAAPPSAKSAKTNFSAALGARSNAAPADYAPGVAGAQEGELQSLLWAARGGNLPQVLKLLAPPHGLLPSDGQDSPFDKPLHRAAEHGRVECMDALVVAGADLEAAGASGFTALHYAAVNGHALCVERLLRAGSSQGATSNADGFKGGMTAAQMAESNKAAPSMAHIFEGRSRGGRRAIGGTRANADDQAGF